MSLLKPDPTFYPSPRLAMQAAPEKHAFVAALNPPGSQLHDALLVVDVDPKSPTYGRRVGQVTMPNLGDELHHFGWNACSSALCPYAPHPHVERRYLVVPGSVSSLRDARVALRRQRRVMGSFRSCNKNCENHIATKIAVVYRPQQSL